MIAAAERGASFKWGCHGCGRNEPLDLALYCARVGPNYPPWNEIGVCQCGAPRTLYGQPGGGTPFTPLKDEWLWLSKEIGYGTDPDAWFEIHWFSDPP